MLSLTDLFSRSAVRVLIDNNLRTDLRRYLLLSTFGYVVLKFLKFKGVLTIEKLGALWNTLISSPN